MLALSHKEPLFPVASAKLAGLPMQQGAPSIRFEVIPMYSLLYHICITYECQVHGSVPVPGPTPVPSSDFRAKNDSAENVDNCSSV